MLNKKFIQYVILLQVLLVSGQAIETEMMTELNKTQQVLSRRKRYLIFPQGSSLQLVFCLTIPTLGQANIFTIGWTAALAWQLPHEASDFLRKRKKKPADSRIDKPGSGSLGGWTVSKQPSPPKQKYKKTYYDPFAIKQPPSLVYTSIYKKAPYSTIHYNATGTNGIINYRKSYKRKPLKPTYNYNQPMRPREGYYDWNHPDSMEPIYHHIHRRTRRDLFTKIQKFFTAQRMDGRACLLKAICEVAQATTNEVGTFAQELIKAIFQVKPYKSEDGVEDEYDVVANLASERDHNCTEQYSACRSSIWYLF